MAISTIPGATGFAYTRVSSGNKTAIGKLTDANHLESFQGDEPEDYDKKIISLYSQSQLYSNDFLNMINKSTPFLIDNGSSSWKWDLSVPYKFPKIVDIPATTLAFLKPGIDGQEFSFVADSNEFSKNSVLSLGSKQYGPRVYITKDPMPYNSAFLYQATLVSDNPQIDFISSQYFKIGTELELIDVSIGEFDQDLGGLGKLAEKITMFETLSSGYGLENTVTAYADSMNLSNNENRESIMVYSAEKRGSLPITRNDLKWEPFIEFLMRKKMLELKVSRMIWSKPGTVKSGGTKQEVKRTPAGLYYKMRNNGNFLEYNRGEFSGNMLRTVFGDLFYRRVDVKDRKVKMYTNEAGFDTFQQALKTDAMNSGITFFSNIDAAQSGNINQASSQNHLTYGFAFDSMVTRETGRIELIHLKELDLPATNTDFGQNKKSTPVFMVFDVSPTGDGTLTNNIREVRMKGQPSMTWGYIDGRRHHLGHAKSQGHSAANKFPGYTIFMEDRCDIFIEDLSRVVLIEETPQI